MRDLQSYFRKAMNIVSNCGIQENFRIIEVKKLRKDADKWGICLLYKSTETAVIKINQRLLDETKIPNDDGLINTLIHEILHACANFEDGHNGMWKYYAEKVEQMTGIKITATTSYQDKGMSAEAIEEARMMAVARKNKYILNCSNPNCTAKWGFSRMCDKVRYPQRFMCGRCHSKLERSF